MEKYIVLSNSPVEFAISGPAGGRDRILVRSENAGLDLIGLAVQSGLDAHRNPTPDFLSLMFTKTRQLNLVSSFPLTDLNPETDSRSSRFGFAWKGYASQIGIEKVEKTLNSQLPELHRAIRSRDIQEIEWALAPLIYRCTEVNERRLRSRRLIFTVLAIYAAIGLVALVSLMVSRFLK